MGPLRAFLTNEQKLRVREHWGAQPQLTHFEVADWVREEFRINVSRSTLYRIAQASDAAFAGRLHKKKTRRVKFPAFETELLAFYHASRVDAGNAQRDPPLTGDMLARKAVELRAKHGIAHDKLKLSNGWLHSFKERHALSSAPVASGLLEATELTVAVSDTVTAAAVETPSTTVATRRSSRTNARRASPSAESSRATEVVVTPPPVIADDTTQDPASVSSPNTGEPPVTVLIQQVAPTPAAPPTPLAKPTTKPLVRILAKAISAVRSGTVLNWEHVQQQQPVAAESHFAIVNDGIQILQDGAYQVNVDLQHTTKADAAFPEVFGVWNGTTRLDQCTSILHCDALGTALSVSETQCCLAAGACIRVEYKAPGHALPQSRIVIRLV